MNTVPQESLEYPGYYQIPGYSIYVISPNGIVVNIKTGNQLKGSINPDGYYNYRLTDDLGQTLTWGRHRLIGYVFKNPGTSIDGLVINHENGIKGDDVINNLSWTTYKGNIEHAGSMGLTDKCVPITVRNVTSGEVRKYASMISAAMDLGMTKDAVAYRCQIGEKRIFPEGLQYRVGHSDENWYDPFDLEKELLFNGTSKPVLVRDVRTGNVTQFPQVTTLATALNVSVSTVSQWLNKPNQPIVNNGLQLKWATDFSPWREIVDLESELREASNRRCVVVTEVASGRELIYSSAVECAQAHGLKTTTLNERLKSDGKKVYKDGYTFRYK